MNLQPGHYTPRWFSVSCLKYAAYSMCSDMVFTLMWSFNKCSSPCSLCSHVRKWSLSPVRVLNASLQIGQANFKSWSSLIRFSFSPIGLPVDSIAIALFGWFAFKLGLISKSVFSSLFSSLELQLDSVEILSLLTGSSGIVCGFGIYSASFTLIPELYIWLVVKADSIGISSDSY